MKDLLQLKGSAAIARQVQWLASRPGANGHIYIHPFEGFSVVDGGREIPVTVNDLLAYGMELKRKGILTDAQTIANGVVYIFDPKRKETLQTFSAVNMRKAKERSAVFSPDLKTRQKTVLAQKQLEEERLAKVTANQERISNPQGGAVSAPLAARTDLPRAVEMLLPILRIVLTGKRRMSQIVDETAMALGFDKRRVGVPIPLNSNQSFNLRASVAVQYLIRKGYLKKNGKQYSEGANANVSRRYV